MAISTEPIPIGEEYIIKLSGRFFERNINIFEIPSIAGDCHQKTYILDIDLINNSEFLDCDLRDEIEFFKKENGDIFFRGIIETSSINNRKARLVIEGYSYKLSKFIIPGLYFNKEVNLRDLLSILISPVEKLRLGRIDAPYNTAFRDFIVIVPIENLALSEDIRIGDVEFYHDFSTQEDAIIEEVSTKNNIPDWIYKNVRARVIVRASEFKEALHEGYNKISIAIDLITLRNDLSFPALKIDKTHRYLNFDYHRFNSQIRTSLWIFCREVNTNAYILMYQKFLNDNSLVLEDNPQSYFDIINELFTCIIHKDVLSSSDKSVLQVIHWIRRAIQNDNNRDKLLDLWTAMEFLASDIKTSHIFSKEEIQSIKLSLGSNIAFPSKQRDVLIKKIDELNNAPLRAKIDELKFKLGIEFTDEEEKIYKDARNKRNDFIHGRECSDILDSELNKLRSIIERLLIGKICLINNLEAN